MCCVLFMLVNFGAHDREGLSWENVLVVDVV